MRKYPMAMVTAPGKVEFRERTLPEIGPRDVLVRVKAASICGGDLHIFKGQHPFAALPVAVGHEISGEVVKIGEGVSRVEKGDRVVVEPVIVCERCHFCRRGQYHLCEEISFQYRMGQGGFTPYFVTRENWVHKLPDGVSYAEGALVEPLSVAVHAVNKSSIQLGQTSAIFGAGAIGLLILLLTKLSGGGDTFIVDIHDFRLDKALELGSKAVFNNLGEDVINRIYEHTSLLGVDKAFEAVGVDVTLVQSLQVLKKGGTAVMVGLFEEPQVNIPANIFVQKEITLTGSQGYCWDFQTALTLIGQRQIDLKPLITHQLPLSQIQEAFDLLMAPKNEAVKVVLNADDF